MKTGESDACAPRAAATPRGPRVEATEALDAPGARGGRQNKLEHVVSALLADHGYHERPAIFVSDSGLLTEARDGFAAGTPYVEVSAGSDDGAERAEVILGGIAQRSATAWARHWRQRADGSIAILIYPAVGTIPGSEAFKLFVAAEG